MRQFLPNAENRQYALTVWFELISIAGWGAVVAGLGITALG